MTKPSRKPRLHLVSGGRDRRRFIGGVEICIAAMEATAPKLDAVVVEEDTYQVLSSDGILHSPNESLQSISAQLSGYVPPHPGEILIRGTDPIEIVAIVHDLDYTPSWRQEWILSALQKVFAQAHKRQLHTMAMPLLGSVHGRFPAIQFLHLLEAVINQEEARYPKTLWLAAPRDELPQLMPVLDRWLEPETP